MGNTHARPEERWAVASDVSCIQEILQEELTDIKHYMWTVINKLDAVCDRLDVIISGGDANNDNGEDSESL